MFHLTTNINKSNENVPQKTKQNKNSSPNDENLSELEKQFMETAFRFAYEALEIQEVPVGCIFVYSNKIIAQGRNTVNETRNATRHAELNCVDQVTDVCKTSQLNVKDVFKETTVYVTVEPCIMCAATIYDLGIKCIVYGCKNSRFGGQTVFDVAAVLKPVTEVKGGYRAEEAMNLLKEFYKGTNPNAPSDKVKIKGKVVKQPDEDQLIDKRDLNVN